MNYGQLTSAICDYTQNFEQDFVANIPVFIKQAEQRIYNTVQFPSLRKNVTGSTSSSNKYLSCPGDFLATYSVAAINTDGSYEYLLNKDVNFIRQAYPNPTSVGFPKYYAIFGPQSADSNELTFILGPTPDAVYGVELHYYYYPSSIVKEGVVTGRLSFSSSLYSYIDGTYDGIAATGGSGTGLTVDVTITSPGGTPEIAVVTTLNGGQDYVVGENVYIPLSVLTGGADVGDLRLTVLTTAAGSTNTTWLSDNFDSVLFYGALVEAATFMKSEADMVTLYNTKYTEALALAKRLGNGMEMQDQYRSGAPRQKVT